MKKGSNHEIVAGLFQHALIQKGARSEHKPAKFLSSCSENVIFIHVNRWRITQMIYTTLNNYEIYRANTQLLKNSYIRKSNSIELDNFLEALNERSCI